MVVIGISFLMGNILKYKICVTHYFCIPGIGWDNCNRFGKLPWFLILVGKLWHAYIMYQNIH